MGHTNSNNQRFSKRKLSVAIVSMLAVSSAALAQEEVAEDLAEEEIVVSGFRASIQDQRRNKRMSKNISDAIFAEDMGKMADENIAEAMQRITGVGIDRVDGEGSQITIRGVEPSLNNVMFNGVVMTNGGDDNGVDFAGMSADMLRSIEVLKSPSANHDEGSLGGTVNLKTWRPLDIKKRRTTLTGQIKYNDLSEETDGTLKFSHADKYLDDSVGVSVSTFYDEVSSRQDIQTNYGWRYTALTAATDAETGEVLAANTRSFEPVGNEKNLKLQTRTRLGGAATFEYRPNDVTSIWMDLSYSQLKKEFVQHNLRATGLRRGNVLDSESNSSVYASSDVAGGIILTRQQEVDTATTVGSLNFQRVMGDWTLDTKASWSHSEESWPMNRRLNFNANTITESVSAEWRDGNGGLLVSPTLTWENEGGNYWNADTLPLAQVWSDFRESSDDLYSLQFDLEGVVEFGPIVGVAVGAKAFERNKERSQTEYNTTFDTEEVVVLGDYETAFPVDNFMSRVDNVEGNGWAVPDVDAVFEAFGTPVPDIDSTGIGENSLEALAGYVMADYEVFGGRLLGDFGVRWVKTESWAFGYSGWRFAAGSDPSEIVTPSEAGNSYINILPSFNGRFVLTDEMLVRFSAAKVMARPKQSKLTPGTNVILTNISNARATGGNPYLDPTEATQYDISWEWYHGETGMLSLAAFYKDISTLSYTKIEELDFVCPEGSPDTVTLCPILTDLPTTQTVNGDGGFVQGIEFAYQQDFTFLPGILKNTGAIFNYTYSDSEASFVDKEQDSATAELLDGYPLENTSKDTLNATLYWENKTVSARLAYNYRSARLASPVNRDASLWWDARETLDFSSSWKVTKALSLTFAITNLTDTYNRKFATILKEDEEGGIVSEGNYLDGGAPDWRTYQLDFNGRNVRLGATYKF